MCIYFVYNQSFVFSGGGVGDHNLKLTVLGERCLFVDNSSRSRRMSLSAFPKSRSLYPSCHVHTQRLGHRQNFSITCQQIRVLVLTPFRRLIRNTSIVTMHI